MQSLLSDLWSLILPLALLLCVALTLLSLLAETFVGKRVRQEKTPTTRPAITKSATSTSNVRGFFVLPLAPVLLLLALWLSPQTIATTATLLTRQSPEALRLLFLAAPLALFFLWCESRSIAQTSEQTSEGEKRDKTTSAATPLERLAARAFGDPSPNSLAHRTARMFVMLFALCCLISLLFDLVPTLAHLYWSQAARIGWHVFSPTISSSIVSWLGVGMILALALPQLCPQPNKVIAWALLLLLPCVLLFYGALCLVAARHASDASDIGSLSVATGSALNADTLLATLGVFRPAFGWLALLCCIPFAASRTVTPRAVSKTIPKTIPKMIPKMIMVRQSATVLSLLLAFACLLGFVGLTAAPIVSSNAWLLGEQGLNPLRTAFFSGYPKEGWLIEASFAALSATTLLALSALMRAALTLLRKNAESNTLLLLMLATMFGMLSSGSKGGGERWQTGLLFILQHTQKIGQLAQGVAALLFLAALCALALRSLATLRR